MKKTFLFLILLMPFSYSWAQVTLIPGYTPGLPFEFDAIWNFQTNSISISPTGVIFKATVKTVNSQIVFEATSKPVLLTSGFQSWEYSSLTPFQINFANNSIGQAAMNAGYLLPGDYVVCIEIISDNVAGAQLAIYCSEIGITNFTPPHLTYPPNNAVIQDPNPLLSWIGPAPILPLANLNYTLQMVELDSGQSANNGFAFNPLKYYQVGIGEENMMYMPSYPMLLFGKHYAWKIISFLGTQEIGQTEIWTFSLNDPSLDSIITSFVYPELGSNSNNSVYTIPPSGYLTFKIFGDYSTNSLNYKLYSPDGELMPTTCITFENSDLEYGYNLFKSNLNNSCIMPENQYFLLEIIDQKGQLLNLKFKY